MDWITIPGSVPSKSNTYRIITIAGHASLGKTKALKEYERTFYLSMGTYRNARVEGLFRLDLRVYFPSLSHDLDNALKVILDCLQTGGAIKNDNRCASIHAEKFIDKANPRVELRITDLEL